MKCFYCKEEQGHGPGCFTRAREANESTWNPWPNIVLEEDLEHTLLPVSTA
jgi:hypothetical protein